MLDLSLRRHLCGHMVSWEFHLTLLSYVLRMGACVFLSTASFFLASPSRTAGVDPCARVHMSTPVSPECVGRTHSSASKSAYCEVANSHPFQYGCRLTDGPSVFKADLIS